MNSNNGKNVNTGKERVLNTALHRQCLKILKAYELDRDTYTSSTHTVEEAADGIRDEIRDGEDAGKVALLTDPRFTPEDLARELIAIGDAVPQKKRDRYHLIWDTENCTDGFDCGNNKKALKEVMENFLIEWMLQFGDGGNRSADDWDRMIYNCWCACYRNADLTPDVDLDEIWSCHLDQNDCKRIGWVTTDEMNEEVYAQYAMMYGWPKRKGV